MLLDDVVEVERITQVVVNGELQDGSSSFGFGASEQVSCGAEPSVEAVVDVDVDAIAGHLVIFRAIRAVVASVRMLAAPTRV